MHLDVSLGFAAPRARGGVFDFVSDRLTVESDDFRSPSVGAALGMRVTERVDLAVELAYASSAVDSEDRDYVDEAGRPIEQTTRFTRVPFGLALRVYPFERGRTVGSFAWIPRDVAPYVGVGGGWTWYRFSQEGEFVDDQTLEIFADRLSSSGASPAFHVLGGTDVSLSPRFGLKGEVRYSWGSAELDRGDFRGFDDIDLAGLQASVGVEVRW